MQRPGEPPPARRSVHDLLCYSTIAIRPEDLPLPVEAPEDRYLLLGACCSQFAAVINGGPLAEQMSRIVGIPPQNLVICIQRYLFEHVSVRGVPVHRCIGFRSKCDLISIYQHVIFVDPRSLGVPVCCQLLPRSRMCAADFVEMLQAFVPVGHRAQISGGEPDPWDPAFRFFRHCSSVVVVWVERTVGERGVAGHGSDRGGPDDDDGDAADSDEASGSDDGVADATCGGAHSLGRSLATSRSRSPHRCAGDGGAGGQHALPQHHASCGGCATAGDGKLAGNCLRPLPGIPTPCRNQPVYGALPS